MHLLDKARWTDTHTHIYLEQFDEDLDEMVGRAINASVGKMYMPNIDSSTIKRLLNLTERFPAHCLPMMGLHPCSVKEDYKEELDIVYRELQTGRYYAVGETGTDLYWDKAWIDQQIASLERQIAFAQEFKLPIVLHSRETLDLNIDIISKRQNGNLRGVFHCFTGTEEQAARIVDLGFFLGIGGVVTFKNTDLRKVLAEIPIEHLVLETDAPYLAPVPYRGKRNEPSYIPEIAKFVAEAKGMGMKELADRTTGNAGRLFGIV